jgi:hypothetical protein
MKAVRVGEEIEAEVEVIARRDDKPICTLRTTVRNGAGEPCLTGTATTWTAPLRDAAILQENSSASAAGLQEKRPPGA